MRYITNVQLTLALTLTARHLYENVQNGTQSWQYQVTRNG